MIVPLLASWAIQGDFDYTSTRVQRACWNERATQVEFYNPPPSWVGGETHSVTCVWDDGTRAHILIKGFSGSSFVWTDRKNERADQILADVGA